MRILFKGWKKLFGGKECDFRSWKRRLKRIKESQKEKISGHYIYSFLDICYIVHFGRKKENLILLYLCWVLYF